MKLVQGHHLRAGGPFVKQTQRDRDDVIKRYIKDDDIEGHVFRMALLGFSPCEMSRLLDIDEERFITLCKIDPKLRQAIKRGGAFADARVSHALYRRAVGANGDPPDTKAAIFWLTNRQPELWRDRRELVGKDGNEIQIRIVRFGEEEPTVIEHAPAAITDEAEEVSASEPQESLE